MLTFRPLRLKFWCKIIFECNSTGWETCRPPPRGIKLENNLGRIGLKGIFKIYNYINNSLLILNCYVLNVGSFCPFVILQISYYIVQFISELFCQILVLLNKRILNRLYLLESETLNRTWKQASPLKKELSLMSYFQTTHPKERFS